MSCPYQQTQQAPQQAPQASASDEWSKYSVTRQALNNYIRASGSMRIPAMLDRSSVGRRIGYENPLRAAGGGAQCGYDRQAQQMMRTQRAQAQQGCSDPWFNDNPERMALAHPEIEAYAGKQFELRRWY
jgi:hypothetical protein